MVLAIALLIVSILGVSTGGSINSTSTTDTTLAQSSCTVVAESYLTVHVFDDDGKPIQDALVVINGTYICLDSRLNQSGRTDSNGDATFAVTPHPATYDVTVILPESYQNQTIVVTDMGTPDPTFHTTVRVGLHQLRASIIPLGDACCFVNETAQPTLLFHWECDLGAEYSANDGSHPQATFLWTDDVGGTFDPSPTSQEVHWRSPRGVICFTINVTVSALGYESDSDSLLVQSMDVSDPSGGYIYPNAQNCPMSVKMHTKTTVSPPRTHRGTHRGPTPPSNTI
jgi:hypothetical protein